jgi:hypothetical protein
MTTTNTQLSSLHDPLKCEPKRHKQSIEIETFHSIGLPGAYVRIKRNKKSGFVTWGMERGPLPSKCKLMKGVLEIIDRHNECLERAFVKTDYVNRYEAISGSNQYGRTSKLSPDLAEDIFNYVCGAIRNTARALRLCHQTPRLTRRPSGVVYDAVLEK